MQISIIYNFSSSTKYKNFIAIFQVFKTFLLKPGVLDFFFVYMNISCPQARAKGVNTAD